MRTVAGEARTCAGLEVMLAPDSAHARERIIATYGNLEKGSIQAHQVPKFSKNDPNYAAAIRTTRCDGQGNFSFEKLPDGTFYVSAPVLWKANPRSPLYEGGIIMQKVTLRGNAVTKVTLP